MMSVAAARVAARERIAKNLGVWASSLAAGSTDPWSLSIALKPPTEAQALADLSAAEVWARSWRAAMPAESAALDWETRNWRRIGRQEVPVRLRFASPDAIATFVGGTAAHDWHLVRDRTALAAAQFGSSEALGAVIRRHVRTILGYDDAEWEQVLAAAQWLSENSVAGLRPRQLPLRGVDTKWFASHRAVVTDLLAALVPGHALGVVESDMLYRVRVLDQDLSAHSLGGLSDFSAPLMQLAGLTLEPRVAFVFENKESVLAMPEWAGAIAIHGNGLDIAAVADLPWMQRCPIVYWGDLDSAGFAILNRLRLHHSRVTTVLMDDDTLLAHRDLWVTDKSPVRGELTMLLPQELRTVHRLQLEADARLEQERIPWETALAALRKADPDGVI
ncbi:hypothetical protein JOF28_001039 [Leucobacter exalbidus]|uniref:DUF3322 and DUF2220 domain-containing protein n=1 Tax=Leucobacter exalbidus TaxID=662960 RepID=A0A940PKW5_9MICO|nr:Wadjet anti-phage system protein JetD domain-containing protein [Leucobacter exalbidus]MBP1325807.1 hypothetical protein [Leucobacter exalbidus]